jgi:hypothetical protein
MTNISKNRNNRRRSRKKSNLSKKMDMFKEELSLDADKEFVTQFQVLVDFYFKNPKLFNLIGEKLDNVFIKN